MISQTWIVVLVIWAICAVVAICTKTPQVMVIPAIGTLLAACC